MFPEQRNALANGLTEPGSGSRRSSAKFLAEQSITHTHTPLPPPHTEKETTANEAARCRFYCCCCCCCCDRPRRQAPIFDLNVVVVPVNAGRILRSPTLSVRYAWHRLLKDSPRDGAIPALYGTRHRRFPAESAPFDRPMRGHA